MSEKYNGWSNYETWAVHLWLSNDEPSYRMIRDLCQGNNDELQGPLKLKRFIEDQADECLDVRTHRYLTEGLQFAIDGIISDIFRANLKTIDWLEIWRAFRE